MSAPIYWDPVTSQHLRYDHGRSSWVFPDGTPYASATSSRTSARSTSQEGYGGIARSDYGPVANGNLSAQGLSHDQSNDGPNSDLSKQIEQFTGSVQNRVSTFYDEKDPTSTQFTTRYASLEREPKEEITDPALYKKGVRSRGLVRRTPGDAETLDQEFKRQRNPKKFFVPGKIFRILWPERPGPRHQNGTVITDGGFHGGFHDQTLVVKLRWFVVVKAGSNFCTCLPISTYGGRGVSKPGLNKWQHSIIYTGKKEPDLLPKEEHQDGEEGMMNSIKAVPRRKEDNMDRASRIDYSRIYTVDHYVKVKEFGDVHEKYVKRLRKQWITILTKHLEGDIESSSNEIDDDESGDDKPALPGKETEYLEWVTAKYALPTNSKFMRMQAGDRIGVIDIITDDWWKGRNLHTNEVNLFPVTYIERSVELGSPQATTSYQVNSSTDSRRITSGKSQADTSMGDNLGEEMSDVGPSGTRSEVPAQIDLAETVRQTSSRTDSLGHKGEPYGPEPQLLHHDPNIGEPSVVLGAIPTRSANFDDKSRETNDGKEPEIRGTLSLPQDEADNQGLDIFSNAPEPKPADQADTASEATMPFQGSVMSLPFSRWSDSTIAIDDFVTHELAEFLWLDHECQELSKAGVKRAEIGKERFQRNFRRLLKLFAKDLSDEAVEKDHHAAANLVRHAASAVAGELTFRAAQGQGESPLANTDMDDESTDYFGIQEDGQSDSEVDDFPDQEPEEDHHDVAEAKRFFLSSYALKSLRRGLREFVHPSFGTLLNTLVKKRLSVSDSLASSEIFQFVGEIKDALPETIVYSSDPVGILDRIMAGIERTTRQEWDWWPLQPPKLPSTADSVRVTWRSAFGNTRWKTVPSCFVQDIDSAVAEYLNLIETMPTGQAVEDYLHKRLRRSDSSVAQHIASQTGPRNYAWLSLLHGWWKGAAPQHHEPFDQSSSHNTPNQSSSATHSDSDASISRSHTGARTLASSGSSDSGSSSSSSLVSSPGSRSQLSRHVRTSQALRVLVLVNNTLSEGYQLFQIKVPKGMETKQFFRQLRRKYYKRRGFWALFSVWRYHHCDFYSSEKFCPERFALRQKGHLPPKTNHDYRICDQARDRFPAPPISMEEFYERFYSCGGSSPWSCLGSYFRRSRKDQVIKDPEHGSSSTILASLDRLAYLPQKLTKFNKTDDTLEGFWNLLAKERISFLRVLIWNIICISPGVMFLFLWLFKYSKVVDLQSAAVPVTIVLSNLTLFWTLFLTSTSGQT